MQSSANKRTFDVKFSGKSLIKIRNNNGPVTVPWGTLESTLTQSENSPLITTRCFLFVRKVLIQLRVLPLMPYLFSLMSNRLCGTLSSMIVPHFDYCDVIWGNACNIHLSRLDTLQNTAGKVILGLPRRFPTDTLLKILGWKKLSVRRSIHLNTMVFKSLSNTLPPNLCNIFKTVSNSHRYTTRAGSHGNLVPPPCRNKSDERKFINRGVASFNTLPPSVKHPLPASIAIFKKLISWLF